MLASRGDSPQHGSRLKLTNSILKHHTNRNDLLKVKCVVDGIASDEQVVIASVATSAIVCVVIDKDIHLYDAAVEKTSFSHLATISVDALPERIAINCDSTFLVVGYHIGMIQFIHLPTRKVVFSQEIAQNDDETISIFRWLQFASADDDKTEELLVLLSDLRLMKFINVDLEAVSMALDKQDLEMAMKVKSQIVVEVIALDDGGREGDGNAEALLEDITDVIPLYSSKLASRTLGMNRRCLVVAGRGREPITMWGVSEPDHKTFKLDAISKDLHESSIIRTRVNSSKSKLMTLDENGRFLIWNLPYLYVLYRFEMSTISGPIASPKFIDFSRLLESPNVHSYPQSGPIARPIAEWEHQRHPDADAAPTRSATVLRDVSSRQSNPHGYYRHGSTHIGSGSTSGGPRFSDHSGHGAGPSDGGNPRSKIQRTEVRGRGKGVFGG
ncbi:hypothetical protein SeLEV6574_g06481 [Synchytrium endobioticum]|uniref:KNTC1 N-terminal domain-containing protein n=1 Tax=Synchytrium endobioticum TaxID=286115 RepID=A0A507CNG9_9FUNG|nr:hypothetical protein SeLEV6574_g06481 [Synchytrium endobioticum]